MARYSFVSTATRIIVLLLLIIILSIGGLLWLNFLGVIDAREIVTPVLKSVGLQKKTEIDNIDDPLLREKQELLMTGEELNLRQANLLQQEQQIAEKLNELEQKAADLENKEKDLADRENSFNEKLKAFEDRRVNLEQTAAYFTGMKPLDAIGIMLKMEDTDVVDILRITEEKALAEDKQSLVAYWLSLMPEDRAATLARKMVKKNND